MKRMLLFTVLAALPFFMIASPPSKSLSGKWFNPHFHQTIKIKKRGPTIKVKGLFSKYHWSTFEQRGNRSFEDCDGTVIRMIDRNRILVKNRFHRSRKVFIRHDRRGDYCNRGCAMNHNHNYYDDFGYHGNQGHGNYYDEYDNGNYGSYGNNYNHGDYNGQGNYGNNYSYDIKDLDGTYKVRNSDRRIIIINTRDGLKAKYKGSNERWVKYDRGRNDQSKFENKKGDVFTVEKNGNLNWRKKRGSKTLRFVKVSNDTFG